MADLIPKAPRGYAWSVKDWFKDPEIVLENRETYGVEFRFPVEDLEDPEVMKDVHERVDKLSRHAEKMSEIDRMIEEANQNG